MKLHPLLTHEIGSLAKPSWKIKANRGEMLSDEDRQHLENQIKRYNLPHSATLKNMLTKAEALSIASDLATKLLESTGLDLVWDGEQHRVEMYEYPIRRIDGFVLRGHVRSFDNKYYDKASCTKQPSVTAPFHVDEFNNISRVAKKPVKIPVTGAYTLVDWSFDEHYCAAVELGTIDVHHMQKNSRQRFIEDMSTRVIYPNLRALVDAGARFLQIDEPAATTKRDEIPDFVESLRASIKELAGKAFFSTHICFSDYNRLFPEIRKLEGILDEIHFEYANRDSKDLGRTAKTRVGYEILHKLKPTSFVVGLGVLDVHTDFIESPELVRDRILYAVDIIKDPARIFVAPDCGLRTRSWEVAQKKLHNMVLGKDMACKELGL